MSRVAADKETSGRRRPEPRPKARSVAVTDGAVGDRPFAPAQSLGPTSPQLLSDMQKRAGNRATAALVASRQADKDASPQAPRRTTTMVAKIVFTRAGQVKGNSRIAGHEDELEIHSFSFARGGAQPGTTKEREGETKDVTITKPAGTATEVFMRAFTDGDVIESAVFTVLRQTEDGKVEVANTIELKNGLVSNLNLGRGDIDSITMNFASK